MPDPVTTNRWWGNPWAADPEREGAAGGSALGSAWGSMVDLALVSTESGGESADGSSEPESADGAYESLVADWPDVPPVAKRQITRDDHAQVADLWSIYWKNAKKTDDMVQCFDMAHYQMLVAGRGYAPTGSPPDQSTYYQLFVESLENPPDPTNAEGRGARTAVTSEQVRGRVDVTDTARTLDGIQYVKRSLLQGVPVQVGIRLLNYYRRPNPDLTTNHYVVIVGMGRADRSREAAQTPDAFPPPEYYFTYYDYLYYASSRFYLFNVPNLALMDPDVRRIGDRRVSQIRPTTRAPKAQVDMAQGRSA